MSTIFTKIINEEVPGYKIYEDEYVCAFLDKNPMQKGHALVVPKAEVSYLFDLDEEDYSILMTASRDIALMLKRKLNCERVCVIVEGYQVPHAHIKLIPTNNEDDFDKKNVHEATEDELKEMQDLLTR